MKRHYLLWFLLTIYLAIGIHGPWEASVQSFGGWVYNVLLWPLNLWNYGWNAIWTDQGPVQPRPRGHGGCQ
jgi:hypothetical protein